MKFQAAIIACSMVAIYGHDVQSEETYESLMAQVPSVQNQILDTEGRIPRLTRLHLECTARHAQLQYRVGTGQLPLSGQIATDFGQCGAKLQLADDRLSTAVLANNNSQQYVAAMRPCTIFLRKGLKWSDGQPFTADDFLFWYEDIYQKKDLVPAPAPEFMINGKPGRMSKRDDYAVVFEFPEPYFLFVDILAGDTLIGGGQATGMARASYMGGTLRPTTSSSSCRSTPRWTKPSERQKPPTSTAG